MSNQVEQLQKQLEETLKRLAVLESGKTEKSIQPENLAGCVSVIRVSPENLFGSKQLVDRNQVNAKDENGKPIFIEETKFLEYQESQKKPSKPRNVNKPKQPTKPTEAPAAQDEASEGEAKVIMDPSKAADNV